MKILNRIVSSKAYRVRKKSLIYNERYSRFLRLIKFIRAKIVSVRAYIVNTLDEIIID